MQCAYILMRGMPVNNKALAMRSANYIFHPAVKVQINVLKIMQ